MSAFYGDHSGLRVPEFIELFANRNLQALTRAIVTDPPQFGWLLAFQRDRMQALLKNEQKSRYADFLGPLIDDNFPPAARGRACLRADDAAALG